PDAPYPADECRALGSGRDERVSDPRVAREFGWHGRGRRPARRHRTGRQSADRVWRRALLDDRPRGEPADVVGTQRRRRPRPGGGAPGEAGAVAPATHLGGSPRERPLRWY